MVYEDVDTKGKCVEKCGEDDRCQWYSYNEDNKKCSLLKSCVVRDSDGSHRNVTSGLKKCTPNMGKRAIEVLPICLRQPLSKKIYILLQNLIYFNYSTHLYLLLFRAPVVSAPYL